jgi:hypothetical protein
MMAMAAAIATPAMMMPVRPDLDDGPVVAWQQCLLFFPLPQEQGSLRPVFMKAPRRRSAAPSVVP